MNQQKQIVVSGEGADLSDQKRMKNKARKKAITQALAVSLVSVAEANESLEIIPSYWNTYHCGERIITANGRAFTDYCKNRFCTGCQGIRKAETLNRYLPEIETWDEVFFTTLTAKSVPAEMLQQRIQEFIDAFRLIKDRFRKRHQRKKGPKFIGIRSLECNFNPVNKTYNPHFHLIIRGRIASTSFMREWRLHWGMINAVNPANIRAG
jgi:plasmid rolling circle replication initiator protein Rep